MSEALPLSTHTDDFKVQQQLNELSNHKAPWCSMRCIQGIPSATFSTFVNWSNLQGDNWGMYKAPSQFRLPFTGFWLFNFKIWSWSGSNAGDRVVRIRGDITGLIYTHRWRPSALTEAEQTISWAFVAFKQENIVLDAYQDSGVALAMNGDFHLTWLGGV